MSSPSPWCVRVRAVSESRELPAGSAQRCLLRLASRAPSPAALFVFLLVCVSTLAHSDAGHTHTHARPHTPAHFFVVLPSAVRGGRCVPTTKRRISPIDSGRSSIGHVRFSKVIGFPSVECLLQRASVRVSHHPDRPGNRSGRRAKRFTGRGFSSARSLSCSKHSHQPPAAPARGGPHPGSPCQHCPSPSSHRDMPENLSAGTQAHQTLTVTESGSDTQPEPGPSTFQTKPETGPVRGGSPACGNNKASVKKRADAFIFRTHPVSADRKPKPRGSEPSGSQARKRAVWRAIVFSRATTSLSSPVSPALPSDAPRDGDVKNLVAPLPPLKDERKSRRRGRTYF